MLKLSIISLVLFSTLSFSQTDNCVGGICKGEIIIDSSSYVGVVTGFKDGRILYRRDGNNYENEGSAGQLSKKIESSKMPVGSFGIDESSYVGQIKNVFADGRVEYRRDGNNYNNISRSISPEVPEKNGVKPTVFIIDESSYVGKTKRVFENGKVEYVRQGNNYSNISSNVSPEIAERNGVKKGALIIDESSYVGKTHRIFANGKVEYQRSGNNYTNISSNVSPEVPENKNISRNVNVIDESSYVGVAKTVFKDGRVEYQREGNNYNNISRNLNYEIPALPNGTKKDTVVLDQSNYVGTAKLVFNDGRVQFRRDGNNYDNIGSNLAYEIDTHEKFQKDTEYASPSNTIGEVLHFFSNNKIELSGEWNVICDDLSESVDEVEGVKAGVEVLQPVGSVIVEKIFANSTAKITIDNKVKAIKILSSKELEDLAIRSQWINGLIRGLEGADLKTVSKYAIRKEDYKKLLELLKKDLENPRPFYFSKESMKKVKEHVESELSKNQN